MRKILFLPLIVLLAGTGLNASEEESSPAVVELFTSQGCSSCPSVEEVLSTWGMEAFRKKQIIPLAFHVDYWDYLGWKDPFSSKSATARQERYAAAWETDSIYTPQMVVNGRTGFVGSDQKRAEEALAGLAKNGSGPRLEVTAAWENGALDFSIAAEAGSGTPKGAGYTVIIAVFENNLITKVLRGENAGGTLKNDFVVRTFAKAGVLDTRTAEKFSKTMRVSLAPDWKPENSGLAVFLQNQQTFEIVSSFCLFPVSPAEPPAS